MIRKSRRDVDDVSACLIDHPRDGSLGDVKETCDVRGEHVPQVVFCIFGKELRRDGIELLLDMQTIAARRDGSDYVLVLDDGRELHGDRLLVATGRRPRVAGLGLETAGATFDERGVQVDAHLRAAERLWAVGDVTGVRLLTHVGKYQGEVWPRTSSARRARPATRPSGMWSTRPAFPRPDSARPWR